MELLRSHLKFELFSLMVDNLKWLYLGVSRMWAGIDYVSADFMIYVCSNDVLIDSMLHVV